MSNHLTNNTRIKLLSFSPDDKFDPSHKHSKSNYPTSTDRRLYQIYHQQNSINGHINKLGKKEIQSMWVSNPQEINGFGAINNLRNGKNKYQKTNLSINEKKIRVLSTNVIKNNNQKNIDSISKNRPQSNQSYIAPTNNILNPQTRTLCSLSPYNLYINQKHSYKKLIQSRVKNEKDLTFLTRTFYKSKKQEQTIKKSLVKILAKTIQHEEKQRQKQQIQKRHNDWLQKQRNQNHTKKYMNHLMKYQARKSLLQTNNSAAKQIRQRSQSASSLKSIRSNISSRQKLQRSRMMRQQMKQNIQKAKQRKTMIKRQKSDSVRSKMMKVYQREKNVQSWRIGELDERSKRLMQTIENSRRNKELLKNVVDQSKKKRASKSIINQLNRTLQTRREQGV